MGLTSTAAAAGRKAKAGWRRIRGAARPATGSQQPIDPAVTYTGYYRTLPLDPDLVLYQAHSGAAMACNPYAIFTELLADPEFARLKHVWVLDSKAELRRRKREYAGHAGVRFVADGSPAYLKALATAKYLIQNTSFSAYFVKRPGQVYVNTWHSITVKTLGYDVPGGNHGSRNMVRNLLMADYVVSPNPFMTGIFAHSYRLQGLFPGRILEFGYPRNDVTMHTPRAEVIEELRQRGIEVDPAKRIVLYAPTWRGTLGDIRGGTEDLEEVRSRLAAGIDTDAYQILIKPHQFHYGRLTAEERRSGRFIPRQFNANRLLAAVDILISDYSSIAFDFMVTDRPVLFYIPDLADYTAERGLYFTTDELPGPVTADLDDLAGWINELDATTAASAARYAAMKDRLCAREDGKAARRVVDAVFRGSEHPGVIEGLIDPGRTRVLLHVDNLESGPATEAVLALAAGLDRTKYDITVAGIGHGEQSRENAGRLSSRVLVRAGQPAYTAQEQRALAAVCRHGLTNPLARLRRPEPVLRREWRRRFGDAAFDVVVECSPDPGLVGWLAKQDGRARLVVWQQAGAAPTPLYRAADAVIPSGATPAEVERLLDSR